jgi:ADP-heptose:LPS heptosyltransferase
MQVVIPKSSMRVHVERGLRTIELRAGEVCVMHDVEVASGLRADAFAATQPLPPVPVRWNDRPRDAARMLVPFIGGMGDAVSMLPVIAALHDGCPGLSIHIAATPGPAELFALCPLVASVIPYPPTLDTWQRFDRYLTMEAVCATMQTPGRSLPETFAAAAGIPLTDLRFDLAVPVVDAGQPGDRPPLVAIAVGDGDPAESIRACPASMLRQLVSLLCERGMACVLLGHHDPRWVIPEAPPLVTDLRSRTPRVLELAVWLRAADVVVSHDSFVLHLAGALGRPTIGLFAPTSAAIASPYSTVHAVASAAACSPCHAAAGGCPMGHERCIAWPSVDVTAVADAVLAAIPAAHAPAA